MKSSVRTKYLKRAFNAFALWICMLGIAIMKFNTIMKLNEIQPVESIFNPQNEVGLYFFIGLVLSVILFSVVLYNVALFFKAKRNNQT